MAKGYMRKERKEHNNIMSQAWHTAVFYRMDKMPELKDLIIQDNPTPEPKQSADSMLNVCKMLNTALGGNTVEA